MSQSTMGDRVALWVIGPIGSGKSTLIENLNGWRVVSQDKEFERLLTEHQLPFDTRTHDAITADRFADLRSAASLRTWNAVPTLRQTGDPIVFESTGDKPELFAIELDKDRDAGYASYAIAMNCSLAECLRRNSSRRRVLPDAIVQASWDRFQQLMNAGAYVELLGKEQFRLIDANGQQSILEWINTLIEPE